MERSYNGWSASPNKGNINVAPFVVAGVSFPGGVRIGLVSDVLAHVVLQFHQRVEPLMKEPGCWGFAYRTNRNDPNNLSNHSSATAVDVNAPKHPNGVPTTKTFSGKQIREIHQILSEIEELDECVRWGGDYRGTPDAMHFEVVTTDRAKLGRVVGRINKETNVEKHVVAARRLLGESDKAMIAALNHLKATPANRVVVKAQVSILWSAILTIRAVRSRLPKE